MKGNYFFGRMGKALAAIKQTVIFASRTPESDKVSARLLLKLHRPLGEGPAVEWADGDKEWYYQGKLHRPLGEGPAVEYANGDKYWYYKGKLHRPSSEGPAIECVDGEKEYYEYGIWKKSYKTH